jgi:beta-glucanase (GH16 family)
MALSRARRTLLGVASVVVMTLGVSGAVVVQAGSAAAAPRPLTVSPAQPLVNEATALRGVIAPAKRKVTLQKRVGARWAAVSSKRTGARGAYAFSVTATSTATAYRVTAPAAKVGRKRYPVATTRTASVRGVTGTATLSVLPHPMGNASSRTLPAVARFSPARPGRTVQVLRQTTGGSVVAASGVQGTDGTATLAVPETAAGTRAKYQAVTVHGGRVANTVSPWTAEVAATSKAQTFVDEFNGAGLDTSKWDTREQPYHGNRTCARPSASRVAVSGGTAKLSVRRVPGATSTRVDGKTVPCRYGVWENAMIGTAEGNANPFMQARGVFAARVALQDARGMHGAFWLQGSGANAAEIDVIEHFGVGYPSPLMSKIHYTGAGPIQSATTGNLMGALKGRAATTWNVYSVEWTPTEYVFRINGVETWRTDKPYVSSASQEMVLSLLTSDWALPTLKKPSSTMQVDWVRAWAP